MATLYYTSWEVSGSVAQGDVSAEDKFSFTGTAAASTSTIGTAREQKTVRVYVDEDAYVTWGTDPTASATDGRAMGADNPKYFNIEGRYKISAITRA